MHKHNSDSRNHVCLKKKNQRTINLTNYYVIIFLATLLDPRLYVPGGGYESVRRVQGGAADPSAGTGLSIRENNYFLNQNKGGTLLLS